MLFAVSFFFLFGSHLAENSFVVVLIYFPIFVSSWRMWSSLILSVQQILWSQLLNLSRGRLIFYSAPVFSVCCCSTQTLSPKLFSFFRVGVKCTRKMALSRYKINSVYFPPGQILSSSVHVLPLGVKHMGCPFVFHFRCLDFFPHFHAFHHRIALYFGELFALLFCFLKSDWFAVYLVSVLFSTMLSKPATCFIL